MQEFVKRLVDERKRVHEEMKALVDAADAEKRDLSGDEREKFEKLSDALDDYDARIPKLVEQMERDRQAEEARERVDSLIRPSEDRKADRDPVRELRAWAMGEPGTPRSIEVDLRNLEVKPFVGDDREYHKEVRTLNTSDDSAVVPTSFRRQLLEHLIEDSAIRRTNVTVLTTDSGEALILPKTTAHPSGSITAEGGTIGQSEPTLGQGTLNAYKYTDLIQLSSEVISDTGVDLIGYLARAVAEAVNNAAGADFVVGTGSGEPKGVITAATVGVTGGTGVSGAFTADDLIDLFFSVIERYRRNGFWLMSDTALRNVRKLKDGNNQYLWVPGLAGSVANTILDRPYVTDPNVPTPATAATSVAFGDFSRYFIRDVGAIVLDRSDDFAFDRDLVTYRWKFRTDGDLMDLTGAIKTFKGGTA